MLRWTCTARAALRLALACAAAAPAMAAAAPPTAADAPDGVVVTATRVARPAFEVPAAVDVVEPGERPDAIGVNASEYLGAVAGLLARDRQNYAQDQQLSIRGFGARAQFGIVGLRLYVDGIPATMPDGQGQASHFNLDATERIEVLRGPFSVLYGNASGGVVQVYTRAGSGAPAWRATLVDGAFDTWRGSLNASGALGGLGYDLDVTHFRTDGARDHSSAHRDSGNLRLDFEPLSGNRLTLVANRLSSPDAEDEGSLNRAQYDADWRQAAPSSLQFDTRKSLDQTQLGLIDEQRIGDAQTWRVAAYGGTRNVLQFLSTSRAAQAGPLSPGGVVALRNRFGGLDARWTLDAALAGRPLTLVAGLDWDRLASQRRGYLNYSGTTDGVQGALRRDEDNVLYDFDQYLQADWRFTDRWSTLVGLRHSDVHFDSSDHYIVTGNPDDSGSTRFEAWTPAASLMFHARADLNLYASYGRGFDTPTFDNLAYRADGSSGLNLGLKAAHTDNVELGAKWRRGTRGSLRLALFQAATADEIAVLSAGGGRSTYHNVGQTRRRGIELEADATLGTRWRAALAYTFLDAQYRDGFLACTSSSCAPGTGTPVPAGNRIPGVPRTALYGTLRYGGAAGFSAALESSFLSAVPVNDLNTETAPSYALLGASAGYGWRPRGWALHVFARADNVFDRRYVSAVVVNDTFGRYYLPGAARAGYLGFSATLGGD